MAQGTLLTRRAAGDFDTIISWSVETWGGHPDLSFFLDSWHSPVRRSSPAQPQPPRNWQRWSQPGARQDHRGRSARSASTIPRASSWARVREARGARDADHSADVLQRVHGDGRQPTGQATRPRQIPTPIRCRTGATRAPCSVKAEAEELRHVPAASLIGGGSRREMPAAAWRHCSKRLRDDPAHALLRHLRPSGSPSSLLVVFIGINLTYVITHATPIDPVEQSIAAVTSFGNTSPEAIEMMRTIVARALRPDRHAARAVRQFLAAHRHRRFRPVAVGLPDTGLDPDRARTALDDRAARAPPPCSPGRSATCSAASPATTTTSRSLKLLGRRSPWACTRCPTTSSPSCCWSMFGYLWPVLPITGGYGMNLRRRAGPRRSC